MDTRLRWLLVGQFSSTPEGETFEVTADELPTLLARHTKQARVPAPFSPTGEVALTFGKLRAFQLKELAQTLASSPELRALAIEPPQPKSIPANQPVSAPGSDLVEELLQGTQPTQPNRSDAQRAVDAFVRSFTPASPTAPAKPSTETHAAGLKAAKGLLATAPLARIEGNWRGLKLLLEQLRPDAGMTVHALNTSPSNVTTRLKQALEVAPFERPDAVFVLDECDHTARLTELAELGEEARVPVIAAVAPQLWGFESADTLAKGARWDKPALPQPIDELRTLESAAWVAAAFNPIAVLTEKEGGEQRTAWSSPSLGVAALLARSQRLTGSLAKAFGKGNGITCPAVHEVNDGATPLALPTQAFLPADGQAALATLGLLGLGSARNTDVFLLTSAPMLMRHSPPIFLPAQIWTGRILRLVQWVRDELPAGGSGEDVSRAFSDAAQLFLFSGIPSAGSMDARLVSTDGGSAVHLKATLHPALAGTAVELELTLPLRQ